MSVDRELLLSRCDFLVESQLWPLEKDLNYHGWLSNFSETESAHAECLLHSFIYYSADLTRELFSYAFSQLASTVCHGTCRNKEPKEYWQEFTETMLVTHVTGEDPSTTDSGYHFARMTRQVLGVNPLQIVSNEVALERLYFDDNSKVIFVDDLVGSGNQFCETWIRTHTIAPKVHQSFQRIAQEKNITSYYCPVFCTWKGREKIARVAPQVVLSPAHILLEPYSAFSSKSRCWTKDLLSNSEAFLAAASRRAGIGAKWRGFNDLGLTIAFEHCVPDATLPLFYHESPTWIPLVRRT